MPQPQRNSSNAFLNARVDDHEKRIDDLELRLNKYDVILERLDVLIDVLTKRVEDTASQASQAIDGQEVLTERNENAHRWSVVSIALASSLVVGILTFILGYVLH